MPAYKSVIVGLIAMALIIVAIAVFNSVLPVQVAAFNSESVSLLDALLWIGLPMYLGIFCGQCFYAARAITGPTSLWAIVASVTNSGSTYAALFFSPILFFLIYASSGTGVDSVQSVAFAFQNGFFVQSVMKMVLEQHAGKNAPPATNQDQT